MITFSSLHEDMVHLNSKDFSINFSELSNIILFISLGKMLPLLSSFLHLYPLPTMAGKLCASLPISHLPSPFQISYIHPTTQIPTHFESFLPFYPTKQPPNKLSLASIGASIRPLHHRRWPLFHWIGSPSSSHSKPWLSRYLEVFIFLFLFFIFYFFFK
jgi:hypothetical protein